MKNELGLEIIGKLVGLRAKTYICLKDASSKNKKTKGTEMCVIKKKT